MFGANDVSHKLAQGAMRRVSACQGPLLIFCGRSAAWFATPRWMINSSKARAARPPMAKALAPRRLITLEDAPGRADATARCEGRTHAGHDQSRRHAATRIVAGSCATQAPLSSAAGHARPLLPTLRDMTILRGVMPRHPDAGVCRPAMAKWSSPAFEDLIMRPAAAGARVYNNSTRPAHPLRLADADFDLVSTFAQRQGVSFNVAMTDLVRAASRAASLPASTGSSEASA